MFCDGGLMKATWPASARSLRHHGCCLLLVLWAHGVLGKCIFDEVQDPLRVVKPAPDQEGLPSRYQTPRRARDAAPFQPIRIKTWLPGAQGPVLAQAVRRRLESALAEASTVVSGLLSVRQVPGPLLLSRDINKYCKFIWRDKSVANYNKCGRASNTYRSETCLDVDIPEEHLHTYAVFPHPTQPSYTVLRPSGAGVHDTDFLLYVHTQGTEKCRTEPSVVAYAVHCQSDSQGRPLAGVVVICTEHLKGGRYSHRATVQMLLHEVFHALGFSRKLFNSWRDCTQVSENVVGCSTRGRVTNTDQEGQVRIYTQAVVEALQAHLNSTDQELGSPLENLGAGPGGISSHWEARVLQGSIMSAVLPDPDLVRIDPITLAALQDTGWYSVDLSRAQTLVWGESQGSQFGSLSTCNDSSSYFCTDRLGCHYLHLHKGECQSDPLLEGCRIYKPAANGSECWKDGNEQKRVMEGWSGEIYHSDSRCFFSNLTRENSSLIASVVGRCYRHRCTGINEYQIQLSDSDWLDCPAGHETKVPGYVGVVFCPDMRLCRHPGKASLTSNQSSLLSLNSFFTEREKSPVQQSIASHPNITSLGPGNSSASTAFLVAGFCLLAAIGGAYRKLLCGAGVRVHAAPEAPYDLQLQPV